jgi:error-prone DNA polymerase
VERIVSGRPYTSLRDFWDRARPSRPVAERLALLGAFDSLYAAPATRRDLLARVGTLARQSPQVRQSLQTRQSPQIGPPAALDLFAGQNTSAEDADGMADLVPAGQLRELDVTERVEAELEILGFDLSQHVLDFYAGLLAELNVVRSKDLADCAHGETVLVAGVKVATQTPAVRSGQRIIFASLDDVAGLVDLAFFESVQERCAARLFGSWLLLVRGRVRRAGAGPLAVTVNGTECWDIPALDEIRLSRGLPAVHAAMAAGDVGPGIQPANLATPPADLHPNTWDFDQIPANEASEASEASDEGGRPGNGTGKPLDRSASPLVFANGFTLSPYAETGGPGGNPKKPPRTLWHASPGSTNTPN